MGAKVQIFQQAKLCVAVLHISDNVCNESQIVF